jgi:hypothetical protein
MVALSMNLKSWSNDPRRVFIQARAGLDSTRGISPEAAPKLHIDPLSSALV